jgi:hypothetical protein
LSDAGDAYLLTSSVYGKALGLQPEPVSPPYYQETYDGTAADVFSNGPVWVQDLATTLGLANPAPGQVGATGTQLLAAGAPSYAVNVLDDGNANNYVTLTAGAPEPGTFCAPRVTDGYPPEAIRRRLAEVAGGVVAAA